MNVEYLASSVGTDTVVRMSPADADRLGVAVGLVPELPVVDHVLGEVVVGAIEDVWDGEADDKGSRDEDLCASVDLEPVSIRLTCGWTGSGSLLFGRSRVFRQSDGQCDREDYDDGNDDRDDRRPGRGTLEVVCDGVVVVGVRIPQLLVAGSSSCSVIELLSRRSSTIASVR
jgi:hypothetical protein